MTEEKVNVLGLLFENGPADDLACRVLKTHGLVCVPSAPCLCLALRDPTFAAALLAARLIIPDSAAMVVAWRLRGGKRLHRVSGLALLQHLLQAPAVTEPGALFFVDPSEQESRLNHVYAARQGIMLAESHRYVAPHYKPGHVQDSALLEKVIAANPRYVVINLGGGVQERLGAWLQQEWTRLKPPQTMPAFICTGAAIAFLTGAQTRIPHWADRLGLGWLLRCLYDPRRYVPRYWASLPVLWAVVVKGKSGVSNFQA
jgi:N-acetylglucosaminyldiphosphoundecaprenol N-acetyl-beta-D-mannosaminyltransferase